MGSDYLMPYITKSLVSKQGTSFATAGAGTKPWINSNQTWSLQHQLEFFSQYAADRRGMKFNTAVFVISIGTNDYLDAILGDGGDKAAADLVSSTTNAIVDAILVLFKTTRATKFVVYHLAPLGCIPAVRLAKGLVSESAGCYEPANQIAAEHNQALSMKLDKLRAAGVKDLILFRMSSGFENLLLKDGTAFTSKLTPCCQGETPKGERISCGQTVEEGGKNYAASVDGFYEMNLIAMNDKDEIYEDPESTEVDESEDTDDTGASVEAAVKQEEEIVTMEAAAVNDGDGDGVNTFAAAVVVKDEAVNAKCVGVEAVKGGIMVKGSTANATAKGRVLMKEEHVEGYKTREVLGAKIPRRSERLKKMPHGLDIKALNFKTRKQRFKVQELQGSVKPT
ncbi:unnamed protein product [Closterium sp. Naga37s-1]|nr:unnamed protein product [Closterium sp. Naga37s-1]